jgi:hypothetical protein
VVWDFTVTREWGGSRRGISYLIPNSIQSLPADDICFGNGFFLVGSYNQTTQVYGVMKGIIDVAKSPVHNISWINYDFPPSFKSPHIAGFDNGNFWMGCFEQTPTGFQARLGYSADGVNGLFIRNNPLINSILWEVGKGYLFSVNLRDEQSGNSAYSMVATRFFGRNEEKEYLYEHVLGLGYYVETNLDGLYINASVSVVSKKPFIAANWVDALNILWGGKVTPSILQAPTYKKTPATGFYSRPLGGALYSIRDVIFVEVRGILPGGSVNYETQLTWKFSPPKYPLAVDPTPEEFSSNMNFLIANGQLEPYTRRIL